MVSIVIVTASLNAAQRVINDRKTNQAHLNLISAAQIVRTEMENTICISTAQKDPDTGEIMQNKKRTISGTFKGEMEEAIKSIDDDNRDQYDTTFEITLPNEKKVNVYLVMKKESNYEANFSFTMDSTKEVVYLTMYGSQDQKNKTQTVITWINGKIGVTDYQADKSKKKDSE